MNFFVKLNTQEETKQRKNKETKKKQKQRNCYRTCQEFSFLGELSL